MAFHKKIGRRQAEGSQKRFEQNKRKMDVNLGNVSGMLKNTEIKAEYDTWSWYYTELSNIRMECRRLGLLVRINNSDSPNYLRAYHAHIFTYLQMITTLLPEPIEKKVFKRYYEVEKQILAYYKDNEFMDVKYKISEEIIKTLDALHLFASRIAQEVGLGVKITIEMNKAETLRKRILGE